MKTELFDQIEMLEQVPTDLMTDITVEPAKETGLHSAASHTEIKAEDTFNSFTEQPQMPGNFQQPQQQTAAPAAGQKLNAGNLITGQTAVGFLDMLLPLICVLVIEKINGSKINKRYLQATPDEKKILEPVLHNYLNSINFNVDTPLNALLITVAMIYGTKTIEVMNVQPERSQPVKMPSAFVGQRVETRGRKAGGKNKPKM